MIPEQSISVVIVAFNSAAHIERCVQSVYRELGPCEIIVVDNGSTDNTRHVLSGSLAQCRVVTGHGNIGFGRACNLGASQARGPHILFLNPDAELMHADRHNLTRLLSRSPVGLIAPALVLDGDGKPHSIVRQERHWIVDLVNLLVRLTLPKGLQPSQATNAHPRSTRWLGAAVLLATRSEFDSVGGFDARYFLYYEDRDLSAKYRVARLPLESTFALSARHSAGGSKPPELAPGERSAWATLGWLQYVHRWSGQRTCHLAATALMAAVCVVTTLLRLACRVPGIPDPIERKFRETDGLRRSLVSNASPGGRLACAYPDARAAVRRSFRWTTGDAV